MFLYGERKIKIKTRYNPHLISRIRSLPGARWDGQKRVWLVPPYFFAVEKLLQLIEEFPDHFSTSTIETLQQLHSYYNKQIQLSQSTEPSNGFLPPVPEGKSLFPYQIAGVEYCQSKTEALIADDMGLGKTIEAITLINLWKPNRTLVICPATVREVWVEKLNEWLINGWRIQLVLDKADINPNENKVVYVTNYDRLLKFVSYKEITNKWGRTKKIMEIDPVLEGFDLLIVDEAHYCKNPKAKRTKIVSQIAKTANRKLFLTGTPFLNRPVEIYPILKMLDEDKWGDFWFFVKRYCGAKKGRWGWDFNGATNLEELQNELRATIMIRRLKKDVLKDLPPKVRTIIQLSPTPEIKKLLQQEEKWLDSIEKIMERADEVGWKEALEEVSEDWRIAFTEISRLRHQNALYKLPLVVDFLNDLLEQKDKIVVFAHHQDVIEKLIEVFPNISVSIQGKDSPSERSEAIRKFQEDPNVRIMIASLLASKEGITLTASDTAVFVELDWVPGNILQAEDRIHRIGQEAETCFYYYLVIKGSIDGKIAEKLVRKLDVLEKALNKYPEGEWR